MNSAVDKLFEQAFEQAGYAASGLTAGAREALLRYAEELAKKNGVDHACNAASTFVGEKCDAAPELNAGSQNVTHRCMKESGAAAMSAVISGAARSMEYLARVRSGEMNAKQAMVKIVGETITSAADSALKAAGNAGKQIIVEKYGSREEALKSLASQGLKILLKRSPLGPSVFLVENLSQLFGTVAGKIPAGKLLNPLDRTLQALTNSAEGRIARIAGAGACNVVKSRFPNLMAMLPKHPAILAAGVVVIVANGIAVKNCIERPYQDLVRNTNSLNAAASELERVSASMLKGQTLFGQFLEADARLDATIQAQMSRVEQAGQDALKAILDI